ncbi:MAG: carbohydrate binding family 9 domain-containing protein, partial [Gemmatimonas sp.]
MTPAIPPSRRLVLLYTALSLSACSLLGTPTAARAQDGSGTDRTAAPVNPETVPRPSFRATRTAAPIAIDGKLDEAAWATAPVLTDFVQQLPNTGFPSRFRTEVRLLYDTKHLYVSARNFDPEPDKAITVGLERDFVSSNSDIFGLVLDTFHDRRNSFLFLVNPKGAVRDEQTFNDSRTIVDAWDGIHTV